MKRKRADDIRAMPLTEAAYVLGISYLRAEEMVRSGSLRGVRVGNGWQVSMAQVAHWAETRMGKPKETV